VTFLVPLSFSNVLTEEEGGPCRSLSACVRIAIPFARVDDSAECRLARLAHAVASDEERTRLHGAAARRRMPPSAPLFRVPCRHRCASANPPPSRAPTHCFFRRPAAPSHSVLPPRARRRRRPVDSLPSPPPPGVPSACAVPSPCPSTVHAPVPSVTSVSHAAWGPRASRRSDFTILLCRLPSSQDPFLARALLSLMFPVDARCFRN